jgi:DNA primase catalytic subunit
VLEVDAKQSQRDCFDRSRRILEFLEQYGVPYRLKYSGNCSAHFIIPQEAYQPLIPLERWEEDSRRFRLWAMAHCGVIVDESFSDDEHLLRLPYSLHERTGLVSLPLDPARYDEFRPEMAEVHNVRVEDAWFRTDDLEAKRDGMRRMLREALGDGD